MENSRTMALFKKRVESVYREQSVWSVDKKCSQDKEQPYKETEYDTS